MLLKLRALAALCCAVTLLPPAAAVDLPAIGDSTGSVISPQQERQLGEAFMRSIRQQLTFVDDAQINEYLQGLGYRLSAQSDDAAQPFDFFMVKDPAINAFAGPGGFIGINSGLMTLTASESELAAVLAHEIAHVTQRHLARAYEAAGKLSLPTAAALLAAILLGSQSGQAAQAAIAAVTAGSAQYQINFTRANENEADHIGIETLSKAGFDPRSMPAFFQRLQRTTRLYGDLPPEFLSTHPVNTTRIAEAEGRAERYPPYKAGDELAFHLARTRLRVLSAGNSAREAQLFADQLRDGQYISEPAHRYGYALTLLASGKVEQARREITGLRAKDKDRIAYLIAAADIEMAAKNKAAGLRIFRDALELFPDNRPLTLHYAAALLQAQQATEAKNLLLRYRQHKAVDSEFYRLLVRAAGESGRPGEAHEAQAEYYYLNGETRAAVEQLTLAVRDAKLDFYQSSRIEARLNQLKKEALEEDRGP